MPYETRLQRLLRLRVRLNEEIAAELSRQRAGQQKHARTQRPHVDARAVRTWARAVGHDVNARGRVPSDLVDAYLEAHRDSPP